MRFFAPARFRTFLRAFNGVSTEHLPHSRAEFSSSSNINTRKTFCHSA